VVKAKRSKKKEAVVWFMLPAGSWALIAYLLTASFTGQIDATCVIPPV
jgi:hypothetical protein